MTPNQNFSGIVDVYSQSWGWFIFLGLLQIILGVAAYAYPVLSTIGITTMVAAVLVVSSITQFIQFFVLWGKPQNSIRLLRAVVAGVAGGLMFRYPGLGMEAVAITLSFYFFVSASIQMVLAIDLPIGRFWGIVSSVLTFLMGAFILFAFPFTAIWVPGLLLGIDLVFTGITMIVFGFTIHKPKDAIHAY